MPDGVPSYFSIELRRISPLAAKENVKRFFYRHVREKKHFSAHMCASKASACCALQKIMQKDKVLLHERVIRRGIWSAICRGNSGW